MGDIRDKEFQEHVADEPVDPIEYFRILWDAKWKIIGFSLIVGIATLCYLFTRPNVYRSSAMIKPEMADAKGSSGLGALSSLGLSVGGPSKSEDLEVLLKTDDLTIRIFRKYDLWPIILPDSFDLSGRQRKPGWAQRLLGRQKEAKPFGDWDAIREGKAGLKVSSERKTGVITISYESRSPDGSAKIVKYYLEEAKSRLQEEALSQANSNKEFIQTQIAKSIDPLIRERFYALYGQEVEKEMLARNREQFGFTVIDSPKIPDRKFKPHRTRTAALATIVSFFFSSVFFLILGKK